MTDSHAHDVQKHVKVYIAVFVALAVLTAVTVYVSSLEHSVALAVTVALFIATVKGSLVAGYFMHLITEKKFIYGLLLFTLIFFVGLIFLPLANYYDHPGARYVP